MAFLCFLGSVVVLLFCIQANCEVYHISPDGVTDDCSSCLTFSQLAANSSFIKSNTTMVFLPGSHNLTTTLHISNTDYVSMAASSSTAQIMCESLTAFFLRNIQYIRMSKLEYIGCGRNRVENAIDFVLQDVIFEGCGETETALELIETTTTLITSTFKFNEYGTLRYNDSLHSDNFWAGGAIVATHSNITIRNSVFERNRAQVGGAIYTERECIIVIENTTFIENQALVEPSTTDPSQAMGGVLYQELGNVTITNCQFINNSAPGSNGGVLYSHNSNIFIKASQFTDCTANNGAVFLYYNSSISIDSSQFDRNMATWGGALHSSNSDTLADRSQFRDNRATYGGIMYSLNSSITLNDSQFVLNSATQGGVLHLMDDSKATITGSWFNSSRATTGGAVFCNTCDITIQNSQFYNNSADAPGEGYTQGGVLLSLRGNVLIDSSQFNENAALEGGVLDCIISNMSISNSHFDSNTASYGGAVYAAYSRNVQISGESEFNDNTALDQGGAIFSGYGAVSVNQSHFKRNSAATEGGGLYSVEGSVEIGGSKMEQNRARRGGAVNVYNSTLTLEETELNGNTATVSGGALYCNQFGKNVIVQACFLTNNSAITAGALYCFHCNAILQASNLSKNAATRTAGALYSSRSNITVQACFLNNNTAITAGALYCSRCNVILQASTLNKNIATMTAGALYSSRSNVTVQASTLDGNNSTWGGVAYSANSNIVISNSEMKNSRSNRRSDRKGLGGVLYSFKSSVRINETLFHNNTATDGGGVIHSRSSDIIISGTYFRENIAIFNGGVLYSENDGIAIHKSFFSNSSALVGGVLYVTNSNVSVNTSRFDASSAYCGGVIDSVSNTNVSIEISQFSNNRVTSIGAVLRSSRGYISISNNQFYNNTSDRQGGVLHFFQCQVAINKSQFYYNTALLGSILYSSESIIRTNSLLIRNNTAINDGTFYLSESTIILSVSKFFSNIGSLLATASVINFTKFNSFNGCMASQISRSNFEEGGALTTFQSTVNFDGIITFHDNQADSGGAVHSTESVLNIIGTISIIGNRATRNGGGIYLSRSEVLSQPYSLLRVVNNTASHKGGGLHAAGSSIKITIVRNETLLDIVENRARMGGGLSLQSNAKLYVLKRDSFMDQVRAIQMIGNVADNGGAVYVNDNTEAATCESPSTECFFQVLAIHRIQLPNINTINLYFSRNRARQDLSSATLFGGLLDRCTVSPLAEVHSNVPDINLAIYVYNKSGIDYFSDSAEFTPNTISSAPVQVCFCFNGHPDCSSLEPDHRAVKKGQSLTASLVAVDQVGQPVRASIQSSLRFTRSGLAEGQLFQRVTDNCTDLTFNIFSSRSNEVLTLHADGPCDDAELSKRTITIEFLPCTCPIGFQPQGIEDTTCDCRCHNTITRYVRGCESEKGSFVRREFSSNVWISYSNMSGYLVYPNCPYDYCKPLNLRTSITLSQPNGSDSQCAFHRVSLLCGSCEPGLSLSLGSSRCLTCPHYWPALVVVITLAAVVAGVALVALLLYLNLTVAIGSLNGIIFYANIVAAYRNIFFPYQSQPSFASVFISFLNLDLGIDTCLFEGMTTYSKTWLQLVFPFYVILLVVFLIVISSYSTKFANLIGKRDPVATLATLILLSYARLLGISFVALSAGTLTYEDGLYHRVWLPDATISYFSSVHIPLFLVAILIIIAGLVYTVVLFLWQWLLRLPKHRVFARMRNQKLKIFIETYNIPYTPHHRYWTGMLLLARVILYLVATVNVSNDPHVALTSITFLVVCQICLKVLIRGQIFKMWPTDLLETFFFFNILFLAIFTWYYQSNGTISQEAVINVSVSIAFVVLLVIIVCHVYLYTSIFFKFRQTKIGKKLDEAFKSLSASKTKQHTFETSEDNLLLDMVYRPINTDGYSSSKEQNIMGQQKPAQSVVEVPLKQPNSGDRGYVMKETVISPQKDKESDTYSAPNDTEKHIADKTQGAQPQDESKLSV